MFKVALSDLLSGTYYAVIAIRELDYVLTEIDLKRRDRAGNVRLFSRELFSNLRKDYYEVLPCPTLPKTLFTITNPTKQQDLSPTAQKRKELLQPLYAARYEIFSSKRPDKVCNLIARRNGLNITRTRALFFFWAAYAFADEALETPHVRGADASSRKFQKHSKAKPGPPPKNSTITPQGWAFENEWIEKMLIGWQRFAKAPITVSKVYSKTMVHVWGCKVAENPVNRCVIFHPEGISYPNKRQFVRFMRRHFGDDTYYAGLKGQQTIRNLKASSAHTISERLVNLLEEVQWDAQILEERPGDYLDPLQPGRAIIRVVARCATCSGDVGIGYDYGSESKWAYLMALLSMCMLKSDFGALFGAVISDDHWPAIGIMSKLRGDRGPAIGQGVADVVADVLQVWQEWCASYDAVGKPLAESAHHKQPIPAGPPRQQLSYRTAGEIIRDDLRETVKRFRSADMSHRIADLEQARRIGRGSALTIWNDLYQRGLYMGQMLPVEKLIRYTVPCHIVEICRDGVYFGALRYLSKELENTGLLRRAEVKAIPARAFALNMVVKHIWLELHDCLIKLTAVPIRLNAADSVHNMTYQESRYFESLLNESRRENEQERQALEMQNEIERKKDRSAVANFQRKMPISRSTGRESTIGQHEAIMKRKKT